MHLGMFGLTASITLNVQPTWNVRARDRLVPLAEVLPNRMFLNDTLRELFA
jgi:hypothetical protein